MPRFLLRSKVGYYLDGVSEIPLSSRLGTSLQVIGTLDGTTTPATGGYTYQIDGGTELVRSAQTTTGTRTTGAILVQMDNLAKGQHTLGAFFGVLN